MKNRKPELLVIGLDGAMTSYIRTAIEEGRLPNFRRILENGVVCDNCMTAFPSITPTCWTTIATGAVPAVSNAVDHEIHIPGTPLDTVVNGYDPAYLKGERFWQAAARAGKKSLISGYPAMPAGKEGEGIRTLFAYGNDSGAVAERFIRIGREDTRRRDCGLAFRDGAGNWMPVGGYEGASLAPDGTYRIPGMADPENQPGSHDLLDFAWYLRFEDRGIRFGAAPDSLGSPIPAGTWTPVITRLLPCKDGECIPLSFRAKVLALDPDAGECSLYISGAAVAEETAAPASFAETIRAIPGFTCSSPYRFILYEDKDNASYAEAYGMRADWNLDLIRAAAMAEPFDILFYYEGYIDTVNHLYRPAFENLPGTTPELHGLAVDMYRRAYDLADRTIGRLLDEYADDGTSVVLISDHGSVGNTKEYQACQSFEAEGLTVKNPDGSVDWSRTVAYAHPLTSGHAFVNLKGRDPQGIVEPGDYSAVVDRIIDVLYRTSENGTAFALERGEADLVGQGGDSFCGDVVFGLRGGELGGHVGGVHASQSPSARSRAGGDIRSLCVFSGPAFRKGVTLHRPVDETDIAPTFCAAMGYPIPRDATGGIIRQALAETGA